MRTLLCGLGVIAILASGSGCRRPSGPGSKGSVTAYEPDGKTVIKFEACGKAGRAYDYPSCGAKLRTDVSALLCTRGPGPHRWLYRVGTSSPITQTATCR